MSRYFNTSPSTRGFNKSYRYSQIKAISIPAPPRGASARHLPAREQALFQYQPLHEGLQSFRSIRRRESYFNTSPSTRGFENVIYTAHLQKFQYQPLHEGLPARDAFGQWMAISIPAPPRGASRPLPSHCGERKFQYQPLHEGLQPRWSPIRLLFDFNTSPSTRGFGRAQNAWNAYAISIPAPPRGASLPVSTVHYRSHFNTSPSTRGFPTSLPVP